MPPTLTAIKPKATIAPIRRVRIEDEDGEEYVRSAPVRTAPRAEVEVNLNIADIILGVDAGTQHRPNLDEEHLKSMRAKRERGESLPAIEVYSDGEHFWTNDGNHRIATEIALGNTTIKAIVKPGSLLDVQWASTATNQNHGLNRSTLTKQRQVDAALDHPYSEGMSQNAIAVHCGVDPTMVGDRVKLRNARLGIVAPAIKIVKTANGGTMNVTNVGRKPVAKLERPAVEPPLTNGHVVSYVPPAPAADTPPSPGPTVTKSFVAPCAQGDAAETLRKLVAWFMEKYGLAIVEKEAGLYFSSGDGCVPVASFI